MVTPDSIDPNPPDEKLTAEIMAAIGYQDAVVAAIAEGHLGGVLYSVFGEDFNLRAMPRSSELRCYTADILLPPPFRYSFKSVFSAERLPPKIKAQITTDLTTKVKDILDYSRKCDCLTIPTPEGYLAMDDFMDVARIYLTQIFGKKEHPKVLGDVAESIGIQDDDHLKISRLPKAELVLATYFLQEALASGVLQEVYFLPNSEQLELSSCPQEFMGLNRRYVTDVDLLRHPATTLDLLIPLFAQKFTRVVVQQDTRQSQLEGRTPLAQEEGFYQLQDLN